MSSSPNPLRQALAERVVVADGAMGTMLQARDPSLDDFQGLEGCNEILNVSRPDIVRAVHDAYFAVGVDCVETNTFGANRAALAEYDCAEPVYELSEAGARLAREVADGYATADRPRWVPDAGLPVLGKDGAVYPLSPRELADAHDVFTREYGLGLVGGCCGTTPEHLRLVVERVRGRELAERRPRPEPAAASLYQSVQFRQDLSFLAIGERTNANGSRAFREAMVAEDWNGCVEIARARIRGGAHLLDLCVDYVGRDGVADMKQLAGRLSTASTLPIVLDSTEPPVLEAGLELLGGRAVINSVNYEDGDGPGSRFARIMALAAEHGAGMIALTIDEQGQARTAEHKVAIAERLIAGITGTWSVQESSILVDCLTFTVATGQEESRRDGLETIEAIRELKRRHPDVQTTLGLSNSFGLNPAARQVLNSVFLHECVGAGLDSAIVHASKILPMARIADEQREVALDLIYDRRAEDYDPLTRFLDLFEADAYRDYLELHGLSVQLTEALAEYWHARVRAELGLAGQDPATIDGMLKLEYRGARFSLGYGACPDLEDRAKITALLEPERIGVTLSEEFQLHPEQSTDAIVVHHPEATYFTT